MNRRPRRAFDLYDQIWNIVVNILIFILILDVYSLT